MTNLTKILSIVVAIALMVTVLIPCFTVSAVATTYTLADFEGKYKPLGRTVIKDGNLVFAQSASGIEFNVNGSGDLQFTLKLLSRRTGDADGVAGGYFTVEVDGVKLNADKRYPADRGASWVSNSSNYPYVIVTKDEEKTFTIPGLSAGNHNIRIIGQNEPDISTLAFKSITFGGTIADAPANKEIYIEAIGDSISTGFGLLANSGSMHGYASLYQDATLAWPYLLATSLNADLSVVGRAGIAANYGTGYTGCMQTYYQYTSEQISGTAPYDFSRKADVVVVCLGTNDLSVTNGKTQDQLKEGIKDMLKLARQKNPNAHIVLMYNMMKSGYDSLFSAAASELGGAASRYYSLKLTTNNAAAGSHPNLNAHASYAADLKALIDTFTFEPMPENSPADYTEVDKAIAAANALTPTDYVDFTAVTNAIAAVVRGKTVTEQESVNAMAKAINDAINALTPIVSNTVLTAPASVSSNITTGTNDSGDTKYTAASGAQNTYIAFNQQISADKSYYVSFDFKGGNTAGTGANDYAWSLGLVTDPASPITAPVKANTVPLNIAANISDWRTFGAVVKGSDFANISDTVKYLAVVANNVTAVGEFANFLIKEVDPNYIYPSAMTIKDNYGKMQAGVVVEDGDLAFGITTNCKAWSLDNYFIFDTEIEAGKYYILSFDYKGHNHDAPVNYGAYTAYDGSAFSGSKTSAGVPSTKTAYKNITRIINGDDLLASNRKYFGFVLQSFNTATDQATTLIKNVSLKEVTVPEGCLVPAGFATNAGIVELENNEYAFGIHQSENWEDGYVLFDYELKPDRKYKLSFDTRVHSYQTPISIGSTYSPKSTAGFSDSRKIVLEEPSSAGKYTHMELEFNGSSLYGVVGENTAKYFAFKLYSYGGAGNPANVLVKNVKIIDITPADYTAVEAAKAAAEEYEEKLYTNYAAVTDAIAAVEYGLDITKQAEVDAYAQAIYDAIAALELKPANYEAVEAAKAAAEAVENKELYSNWVDVEAAINAVVYGLDITKQAEVDAMAEAINAAVANLKVNGASYTAVNEAIAAAEALNRDNYVEFTAVDEAIAAVVYGLDITKQAEVDAMAEAINKAIDKLVYNDGFIEEDGKLYFCENGNKALNKGLIYDEASGNYYYIGSKGYALGDGEHWINEKNLNGITVNGEALKAGLYAINDDLSVQILEGIVRADDKIYFYENGLKAVNKGLVYDAETNNYYYIGSKGYAVGEGEHWINEKNLNGITVNSNALKAGLYAVKADCSVTILDGFVEEDGRLYFYANGVKAISKGLVYNAENGKYYYIGSQGFALGAHENGVRWINETKFNGITTPSGTELKAGLYAINDDLSVQILEGIVRADDKIYFYENGLKAVNKGLVYDEEKGKYYYIGSKGYAVGAGEHWINNVRLNGITIGGNALKAGFYIVNEDCSVVI